jgi:outer membrane usher protein FimD/PapC
VLRYSASLTRNTTLVAELQNNRLNGVRERGAFLFLRVALDNDRWIGATARSTGDTRTVDVEAGQLAPQGEGVGWRVAVNADARPGQVSTSSAAAVQWNLAPATLEFYGNTPLGGPGAQYTEFAVSGALVGVDGFWGLTRRVSDSFAVARLGVPQPGVEILVNNEVQGRTDSKGQAFLPRIGAFGRQDISVNEKQIGMDFNLPERRRTIVPAYRSGTLVDFAGKKMSAIAGMAWLGTGAQRKPVVSRSWTMTGAGGSLTVETTNAGDFYVEDAQPGQYTGTLESGGKRYACKLEVPAFAEAVLEIKEGLTCD